MGNVVVPAALSITFLVFIERKSENVIGCFEQPYCRLNIFGTIIHTVKTFCDMFYIWSFIRLNNIIVKGLNKKQIYENVIQINILAMG